MADADITHHYATAQFCSTSDYRHYNSAPIETWFEDTSFRFQMSQDWNIGIVKKADGVDRRERKGKTGEYLQFVKTRNESCTVEDGELDIEMALEAS